MDVASFQVCVLTDTFSYSLLLSLVGPFSLRMCFGKYCIFIVLFCGDIFNVLKTDIFVMRLKHFGFQDSERIGTAARELLRQDLTAIIM